MPKASEIFPAAVSNSGAKIRLRSEALHRLEGTEMHTAATISEVRSRTGHPITRKRLGFDSSSFSAYPRSRVSRSALKITLPPSRTYLRAFGSSAIRWMYCRNQASGISANQRAPQRGAVQGKIGADVQVDGDNLRSFDALDIDQFIAIARTAILTASRCGARKTRVRTGAIIALNQDRRNMHTPTPEREEPI